MAADLLRLNTRQHAHLFISFLLSKYFPVREVLARWSHDREMKINIYVADQNPMLDRSFGISRMSEGILAMLMRQRDVEMQVVVSQSSVQAPMGAKRTLIPWKTSRRWLRLLTDHLHTLWADAADIYYFPKGFLPLLMGKARPAVVTIHDTIIQYSHDHYPRWRSEWEYRYWEWMLKQTLLKADCILTVSQTSKHQIETFMQRYDVPKKAITVTYEPCPYESVAQPQAPLKENYVIHLASREPHKRTAHLMRWWAEAEAAGRALPLLHLIGTLPAGMEEMLAASRTMVKRPFLEDSALQAAYMGAKALILPSEIEGFGLPALEAYYLGTPVCHVAGTSVEEILSVATHKGRFDLDKRESLFAALEEVCNMSADEVHSCGEVLRENYSADRVMGTMMAAFSHLLAQRKSEEREFNRESRR